MKIEEFDVIGEAVKASSCCKVHAAKSERILCKINKLSAMYGCRSVSLNILGDESAFEKIRTAIEDLINEFQKEKSSQQKCAECSEGLLKRLLVGVFSSN